MSIASMSARGTITSSTRMSPSFRMARSMVRSSAESVAPAASSAAMASSISARAEPFWRSAERAQKCGPEPGYYVRLLARGFGRRAVGTSTLVVAHSSEAAA